MSEGPYNGDRGSIVRILTYLIWEAMEKWYPEQGG